jgi:hypothetical protein
VVDAGSIRSVDDFARGLSALRERAGQTVRQVARTTGVPTATLGGYFSGRHLPPTHRPQVLASILRACGVLDADEVHAWLDALSRVRTTPGRTPCPHAQPLAPLGLWRGHRLLRVQPDRLLDAALDNLRRILRLSTQHRLLIIASPQACVSAHAAPRPLVLVLDRSVPEIESLERAAAAAVGAPHPN